ncbi:sulfoxide reductase heme-binding subunit YedZ [Burkholderiales bacterium]|nr:sulfoxide reductase heme-binding subunit YedZ [Burkholderiales bacterium]
MAYSARAPRPSSKSKRLNIPLIWLGSSLPLVVLVLRAITSELTANPIEFISQFTGWWTLVFLMLTLSVTPIRALFNMPLVFPLRRTLGLITFFYSLVHFLSWLVLDQYFDWTEILLDLMDRPFIYFGFTAFVGLLILAITSINRAKVIIGPMRWIWLHKSVYIVAILGVIHFFILVKRDITEPLIFASVLFLLLGYRILVFIRKKRKLRIK